MTKKSKNVCEEELLFVCERAKTCDEHGECYHATPHPFDDSETGGCTDPTCNKIPTKCIPHNLNKKTAKQFAKIVAERILK